MSKELFQQERENAGASHEYIQHEMLNQEHEQQQAGPLPVVDLNALLPNGDIMKVEKDTLDLTSVDIAFKIIDSIKAGKIDVLDFAVKRKLLVDAMDLVMRDKEIKAAAIEAIEQHGKAGCIKFGAKISITNKVTYQYEADPLWKKLKEQLQPLADELKEQEDKIKAACKTNASLVSSEGELIAAVVPAPSTQSISVSFSKRK